MATEITITFRSDAPYTAGEVKQLEEEFKSFLGEFGDDDADLGSVQVNAMTSAEAKAARREELAEFLNLSFVSARVTVKHPDIDEPVELDLQDVAGDFVGAEDEEA